MCISTHLKVVAFVELFVIKIYSFAPEIKETEFMVLKKFTPASLREIANIDRSLSISRLELDGDVNAS